MAAALEHEGNQVPIRVSVAEAKSQKFELGGGYSTDRGARGFIRYTDSNLRDLGWRWFTNLELDRLAQKLNSRVELPPDARGIRYAFGGRIETESIQGQNTDRAGLTTARLKSDERNESTQSLSYELERLREGNVLQDDRHATFVNQSWLFNRTDNLLAPRAGYLVGAEVGGAARALLSTRSFGRVTGRAVWLYSPTAKDTFQLRGQVGLVAAEARTGIPSTYLFRTGGDTTVRGYALDSLGASENGAVVGGRYLAVASAEYTRWLSREWGAAVFYDAGNAVDRWADYKAAKGYGVGARWSSPFGRLSLDVAYGEQVHKLRLHFSVGVAFK